MEKRFWKYLFTAVVVIQLCSFLPLTVGADETDTVPLVSYEVSDIALTPGKDATHLNIAWHTDSSINGCVVEIAEKHKMHPRHFAKWDKFYKHPNNSRRFMGSTQYCGTDENSVETYACEVIVRGLHEFTEYVYRLGDNNGNWSGIYEYSTAGTKKFGFIYLADSQLGASVKSSMTDEQKAAALAGDIAGWVNTVDIINTNFPQAAFILSGGDQVELPGEEKQWTGFFSAPELSSLPVAPTIGSHDDFINGRGGSLDTTLPNFGYHFNLPNESEAYGISAAGGDYYFTYGDVLYIVLNMDPQIAAYTMPPPGEACDPALTMDCSEHEVFMQEAIASHPHVKWKIVTWHYSIYSSGMHAQDCNINAMRDAMVPIIDSLDIDVIFMAHDHCFARSYQMLGNEALTEQTVGINGEIINPAGTLYFSGNSSSGSKYYGLYSDVESLDYLAAYSQLYVPSFSYVIVERDRMSISTYRTDTMEVTDTYTIVKHRDKHHK